MTQEERDIEPSARARWIFVTLLFLMFLVGFVFHQEFSRIEIPKNASNDELEEIVKRYHSLISYIKYVSFLIGLGFSSYFFFLGYQSLKHREFPPPNTAVILRTKIVTGSMAKFNSVGCFVIGVLSWVGLFVGFMLEYILHDIT